LIKSNVKKLKIIHTNIGGKLNRGNLVILRSTVPIGTCRNFDKAKLEEASGLVCGVDFNLTFAPDRQELQPMYIRNGAVYLTKRETILSSSYKGSKSLALIMREERSVNIDTTSDFELVEWTLTKSKHANSSFRI